MFQEDVLIRVFMNLDSVLMNKKQQPTKQSKQSKQSKQTKPIKTIKTIKMRKRRTWARIEQQVVWFFHQLQQIPSYKTKH